MTTDKQPGKQPAARQNPGYLAVIRRVKSGDCDCDNYIAYDENGDWRAKGRADQAPAESGRKLAEYLFHADEIGGVQVIGGETWAWILTT